MRLSKRLETVASFVGEGSRIADVGTDHGYIPIVLTERRKAAGAIAMDIGFGPLQRAVEHIRERGLEERIETRLSDGVQGLAPGEADTVIIAGMGGELVIHILEGGAHLWDAVQHWILSPQSELGKVRRFLEIHGFLIAKEDMVEEDGKYYTVMDVVRKGGEQQAEEPEEPGRAGAALFVERAEGSDSGSDPPGGSGSRTGGEPGKAAGERQEARDLFGPRLIEAKHPVLREFLKREERMLENLVENLGQRSGPGALARKKELEQKLSLVKRVLEDWEEGKTEKEAAESA